MKKLLFIFLLLLTSPCLLFAQTENRSTISSDSIQYDKERIIKVIKKHSQIVRSGEYLGKKIFLQFTTDTNDSTVDVGIIANGEIIGGFFIHPWSVCQYPNQNCMPWLCQRAPTQRAKLYLD